MLPRYMIRSHMNSDHVFCAISMGTANKIMMIQLNQSSPGKVETKDIYLLAG